MKRIALLLVLALTISACSKKEEAVTAGGQPNMAAAPSPEASAKAAGNPERRFLAYEHRVEAEVEVDQLERLYRELQDACLKEATWHCTVLDASIRLDRDQRGGSAHLNLRASTEGVRAMRTRLAQSGGIVSQGTHVDDLGQPIAEVDKRLAMLQDYRAKLLELQQKATKVEDLTVIAEKLAETQAELEAAKGQNAHLMDRVNREALTIDLETRRTAASSLWAPIGSALREFFPSLAHAVAGVIVALAYLLPWALVLSVLGWGVAKLRRKWRQRKSRSE
ncbi:DUF4349 domain-containing protein [uncultured Ralstonia sp.]|jgi:hypothetical protein|uniref:DUF4349 domain-containing protein n=1 Tax=Ralstonia sp. TaxID=54061 RepID=UPI001EA6FE5D|nr:DUF4349 domain-containing protein [uncultured Ralstonia sp.]UCF24970.1 MAG: DUF4349 domain-containing protein [Ralstonia sp.]